MQNLNNSYTNLQDIFEQNLNVNLLAEVITKCKLTADAQVVKKEMEELEYDYFGVEEGDRVVGYVKQNDLNKGSVKDCYTPFSAGDLISDSTSLTEVLNIFNKKDCVFVLEKDRVTKLVTVADLHKQPIRMLAFSLISILEMSLIELIKDEYQNDDWKNLLSESRVEIANELYEVRRDKNEALSLIDNIQLGDKGTIIKKTDSLRNKLGFSSNRVCVKFFGKVETLRNDIAHSQQHISLDHKELIDIILQVKDVLNIIVSDSKEKEIILK